jgi:hypothetical protein
MLLLWKTIRIEAKGAEFGRAMPTGPGERKFWEQKKMPESCRADSDLLSNADFRTSPQESGYRLKAVNSEKAIEPMVAERQYLAEPRWSRISAAFS